MFMTEADIAKDFREAKSKTEQIQTLAIMNEITETEVVEILLEYGCPPEMIPNRIYQKYMDAQHGNDSEVEKDCPETDTPPIPGKIERILMGRIQEIDIIIKRDEATIRSWQKEVRVLKAERKEILAFLGKRGDDGDA